MLRFTFIIKCTYTSRDRYTLSKNINKSICLLQYNMKTKIHDYSIDVCRRVLTIRLIILYFGKSLSVFPSVHLSFDLHENCSHSELQPRPMCCTEHDDVQYDFSLYGCGQIIELNDFCVVFAVSSTPMLCYDSGVPV